LTARGAFALAFIANASCSPRTPGAIVSPPPVPLASERAAMAERLAASDRDAMVARRLTNARIAEVRARDVTLKNDTNERFLVTIRNRGNRPIVKLVMGMTLFGEDRHRLGLTEFSIVRRIAPGQVETVPVNVAFLLFAEGAPRVRAAAGRPKVLDVDVQDIVLVGTTDRETD
jgi:hypothetical protein